MNSNNIDEVYYEYQVPFCQPFQCSLSRHGYTDRERGKVLWNCMPVYCKNYITILLAVIAMLATMTISFNCLILGINLASKTRRMRKRNPTMSNYSIYVVSLAVADLLVGIVVLPLCVTHFYLEFFTNKLETYGSTGNKIFSSVLSQQHVVQPRIQKLPDDINFTVTTIGTDVRDVYRDNSTGVRDALGVFTHLTLFVSIYTLITASADRFYAATYSTYLNRSHISKSGITTKLECLQKALCSLRRSTVAVFIVWMLGIMFAVLPLILGNKFYFRHVGHIFAAMTSFSNHSTGILWYLVMLAIPLVGIWTLNLLICLTLWRRKSQLGQRRRRSLRRTPKKSSPTNDASRPLAGRLTSNSDSVFEHSVTESKTATSPKYTASQLEGNNNTSDVSDPKPHAVHLRALYRNKPSNGSSTSRHLGSFRSQTLTLDSRSSGIRRKASSLRRAKELLRRQSYEANITKTLCIVVIAFTLAVLPLIVTLGRIMLEKNTKKDTLNNEVTALTCSILLLFSNSFVNCVIYGARMRDFRTTLCQIFRNFFDKIKNTLCCYSLRSNSNHSSEVVSGVFLVTRQNKPNAYERSLRLQGISSRDKLRIYSGTSSIKSANRVSTSDNIVSERQEINKIDNRISKEIVSLCKKNVRPSSSGYRTDQELPSTHEDNVKHILSPKSGIVEQTKIEIADEMYINKSHYKESNLKIPLNEENSENSSKIRTPQRSITEPTIHDDEDITSEIPVITDDSHSENCINQSAEKIMADEAQDTTILNAHGWATPVSNISKDTVTDNNNCSLDSNLKNRDDFTLDIDFTNLSQ